MISYVNKFFLKILDDFVSNLKCSLILTLKFSHFCLEFRLHTPNLALKSEQAGVYGADFEVESTLITRRNLTELVQVDYWLMIHLINYGE